VPLLRRSATEFRALGDSEGAGVAQMALAYVAPASENYELTEAQLLESAADLFQAGDLWAVTRQCKGVLKLRWPRATPSKRETCTRTAWSWLGTRATPVVKRRRCWLGFVELVHEDPWPGG
jgi:hypothetical protein